MTLRQPSWFENAAHHAETDRQTTAGYVAQCGVAGPYDLLPSPSTSGGMRLTFGPGSIFIAGGEDPWQGVYHCVNDSTYDVPLAGANATLPRIDIVVARVNDPDYGSTGNAWDLIPITGTPAQAPTAPTGQMQAGDELICQARIDAASTSIKATNVLSRRRIVRFRNSQSVGTTADRDALAPYNGMLIYREDLQQQQWYQGGAWWAPLVAAEDGSVHITGDVFVTGGSARLTADYLTVNGNANVGGNLASDSLTATVATIANTLTGGGNIVSGGSFIDRFGRDIVALLGSGGLRADTAASVDTPPYQRAAGIWLANATLFSMTGTVLTAVLGAGQAMQIWIVSAVNEAASGIAPIMAVRTAAVADGTAWNGWRTVAWAQQQMWVGKAHFNGSTGLNNFGNNYYSGSFSFPAGRFTTVPIVHISVVSGSGSAIGYTALVTAITTSTYSLRVDFPGTYTDPIDVQVIAIQQS